MGTKGNATLEGEVGYAFEAKGSVTGCVSGPPAFSVSTSIKDQWPSSYINLSSGFKPLITVPCGFEVCFLVFGKPNEHDTEAMATAYNPTRYSSLVKFLSFHVCSNVYRMRS